MISVGLFLRILSLFMGSLSYPREAQKLCLGIVSIDGGKPSVLQAAKMNFLKSLASSGAQSWKAQTINPSVTLPSHASMLSGLSPKVHRVDWNTWKPEMGSFRFETVFSLARASAYKTALFATKEKFKHFNAPGTLDRFLYEEVSAKRISERTVDYFRSESPHLFFVHYSEADSTGHTYGWGSGQQIRALIEIDQALKELVEGVRSVRADCHFIITSDHGGHGKSHGSTSPEDMTIPWIANGPRFRAISLKSDIITMDTAVTVLHLLGIATPKGALGQVVHEALLSE